jgi:IPT/TIG domain-containing protein
MKRGIALGLAALAVVMALSVAAATAAAAPTISSVSPNSGPKAGGTVVTITGTNFTGATTVKFGSNAAAGFTVNSPTSITATSPAAAIPGTVDITVTTSSGTSFTSPNDHFAYLGPPTVSSVSPNSGPKSGGTAVTITGTGFTGATGVKFGTVAATSFTVNSATSITATSPAGISPIAVDVTVTTPNGTSGTTPSDRFTYFVATVTGVSPSSGPQGGGTTVTVTGTHLDDATGVRFGTQSTTAFTVDSPTQLTVTSPAAPAPGTVDVIVIGSSGTSSASTSDRYTYLAPPRITAVSPSSGPKAGGNPVTITGANFSGATAVKFGSNDATSFTVDSDGQITAVAPASALATTVDVRVTSPNGTSAFTPVDHYTYVVPAVSAVAPASGPLSGGTVVTITGSHLDGATSVRFGNVEASDFTVDSPTQITAVSPAGLAAIPVDVTVTTPNGTSSVSTADRFAYLAPPSITGLDPSSGPTTGGTTVTITGKHFDGASAVKFGTKDALAFTVDSDTQITATAPAGPAGIVDVKVTTVNGTSASGPADHYTYVRVPTTVTAEPAVVQVAGLQLNLFGLHATLRDADGNPIAGKSVAFTAGATAICSAPTNSAGVASCGGTASALQIVLANGYTASFAGNSTYAPSSGHGALIG